MMIRSYNPTNWYWRVGENSTQVFSSARGQYVPITDSAYVEWLDAGQWPTNIASAAELSEILAAEAPGVTGPST